MNGWRYVKSYEKEWTEATDCNGIPKATINDDGMEGARRFHLNVYFPENRCCIYEEHIKYVEEAIQKFKEFLAYNSETEEP